MTQLPPLPGTLAAYLTKVASVIEIVFTVHVVFCCNIGSLDTSVDTSLSTLSRSLSDIFFMLLLCDVFSVKSKCRHSCQFLRLYDAMSIFLLCVESILAEQCMCMIRTSCIDYYVVLLPHASTVCVDDALHENLHKKLCHCGKLNISRCESRHERS
jgi:hypothetical protein